MHVLIYFIYFTEQISSSSSSFIFDIKIEMWTIYNKRSRFIQKRLESFDCSRKKKKSKMNLLSR